MKLKTQKIRGNDYVVVNERVRAFRAHESFKDMSIETEILNISDDRVVMIARVKDANGNIKATGHAEEVQTKSGVNSTSFIENCETSAVGRCLGFLGIGVDDSIATFEEVERAIERQEEKPSPTPTALNHRAMAPAAPEVEESDPLDWKEVVCPLKKHKGTKTGVIAESDPDYLEYFSTKLDTMQDQKFAWAIGQFMKTRNQDGNQGFELVA
jgi:hypothetical protein